MIRFILLFVLLCLDVASKLGAILWLHPLQGSVYPYGGVPVFANILGVSFSLNYVVNSGAAWGLFSGHATLLFFFRVLMIFGLVGYLVFNRKRKGLKFPFWLIVTGALGNVIDYGLYDHVIDFFHFVFWGYSFPIFNFADAYISLGVLTLLLGPVS